MRGDDFKKAVGAGALFLCARCGRGNRWPRKRTGSGQAYKEVIGREAGGFDFAVGRRGSRGLWRNLAIWQSGDGTLIVSGGQVQGVARQEGAGGGIGGGGAGPGGWWRGRIGRYGPDGGGALEGFVRKLQCFVIVFAQFRLRGVLATVWGRVLGLGVRGPCYIGRLVHV